MLIISFLFFVIQTTPFLAYGYFRNRIKPILTRMGRSKFVLVPRIKQAQLENVTTGKANTFHHHCSSSLSLIKLQNKLFPNSLRKNRLFLDEKKHGFNKIFT